MHINTFSKFTKPDNVTH